MVDFVLVAGAWLGSWAWGQVVPELRAVGHGAHPLTLSGLAEKRGVPARRQTHVQDIVSEVERLGHHDDVVLVGHSYGGIPVGQAAGRVCDRLARLVRLVFIDCPVPADGESCLSNWPDGGALVEAAIADNEGFWATPDRAAYAGQGLTDDQIERIMDGSTPHPGATLIEPAVLTRPLADIPGTYIKCLLNSAEPSADVAELVSSDNWRLVEMETGHWPMFSRPAELARLLLDAAGA